MKKIGFVPKCEEESGGESTVIEHNRGAEAVKKITFWYRRNPVETLIHTLGVSGIIAVLVIGIVCFLVFIQTIRGQEPNIPELLSNISLLIIGYYFGRKTPKDAKVSKQPIGFNAKEDREQGAAADANKARR